MTQLQQSQQSQRFQQLDSSQHPHFSQLTTLGVGGAIDTFLEPTTRVGVIEAIEEADARQVPLCVIGGGSNIVASDEPFHGVVLRDARRMITVPDEAAPVEQGEPVVHLNAEAGCNWDDFVAFALSLGLAGVEGLSGIPGTVGASVVQNIGAYGQEVASSVASVEVWDRLTKTTRNLSAQDMQFGYRTSLLKTSMYASGASVKGSSSPSSSLQENAGAGLPHSAFFPTPRYVVLSVTFRLRHTAHGVVRYDQLAHALGVAVGESLDAELIRAQVLRIRAAKGMLEDPLRYAQPLMTATKRPEYVREAMALLESTSQQASQASQASQTPPTVTQAPQPDLQQIARHSCGSFFMNPVLSAQQASQLPPDAPRFEAQLADGSPAVKTSAAWLIDHAGFHKGFALAGHERASVSPLHTLALVNRGEASSEDIALLAKSVIEGVERQFGVRLVPEPVVIGMTI